MVLWTCANDCILYSLTNVAICHTWMPELGSAIVRSTLEFEENELVIVEIRDFTDASLHHCFRKFYSILISYCLHMLESG